MIFCQIDSELIEIIKKEANGKMVVDCGAGNGLLGSMMENVIGLDIFPGGLTQDKLLSNVLALDCETFKFPPRCLPVFIRPCHSGFPERTIDRNFEKFETVLYVSDPKNMKADLGSVVKNFDVERIGTWVGKDGEQCFRITVNEPNSIPTMTLVLVAQKLGWDGQVTQIAWWELGEKHKGDTKLIKQNGFSYCYLGSSEILETIENATWDMAETKENKAKTTFYQDLLRDSTDKSLKLGWLSPDGTMHYCKYQNHIVYVDEILETSVPEIEAKGWIHIYSDVTHLHSTKRITQAQARTAREELGLIVDDDDIIYQ